MASSIFKQQCPTCEAMVPIKDRGLVGKKIDCPKCKARFVVADPDAGAEDSDDKAKKKDKDDDKAAKGKGDAKASKKKRASDDYEDDEEGLGRPQRKPKKAEGNTKMMLGVGLTLLALVLLGVAGFFMFGTGEDKKGKSGGGSGGGGQVAQDAPPETPPEKKEEPKPTVALASDVTNLLPGDAEVVVNLASQDILRSSPRQSFGGPRLAPRAERGLGERGQANR